MQAFLPVSVRRRRFRVLFRRLRRTRSLGLNSCLERSSRRSTKEKPRRR